MTRTLIRNATLVSSWRHPIMDWCHILKDAEMTDELLDVNGHEIQSSSP